MSVLTGFVKVRDQLICSSFTGFIFTLTLSPDAATHPLVQQLALTCLYPRSLLSPTDAEFSARFMKVLHDIGTPGYSTVASYANVRFIMPRKIYLDGLSRILERIAIWCSSWRNDILSFRTPVSKFGYVDSNVSTLPAQLIQRLQVGSIASFWMIWNSGARTKLRSEVESQIQRQRFQVSSVVLL